MGWMQLIFMEGGELPTIHSDDDPRFGGGAPRGNETEKWGRGGIVSGDKAHSGSDRIEQARVLSRTKRVEKARRAPRIQ